MRGTIKNNRTIQAQRPPHTATPSAQILLLTSFSLVSTTTARINSSSRLAHRRLSSVTQIPIVFVAFILVFLLLLTLEICVTWYDDKATDSSDGHTVASEVSHSNTVSCNKYPPPDNQSVGPMIIVIPHKEKEDVVP